jgi:hypothetical protein
LISLLFGKARDASTLYNEKAMKQFVILKLVGLAVLTMVTLVIISILEVTIYSYVINPGQDVSAYEAHANSSAPFVSGIFGFVIFFLVARRWKRRGYHNAFNLALLFPAVYVLLDVVVLLLAGTTQWSDFILVFVLANGAKFIGSYLGYKFSSSPQSVSA